MNLLTDVPGLQVGHAQDEKLASGVTCVLFDEPAVASISIQGGAPGVRDGALLEADMSVEKVNGLVLSGGSAFGLDAMGGVQGFLREQGRGFRIANAIVPIVPGAIIFDLSNGGDKNWDRRPPYWDLGYEAAVAARSGSFGLGTIGAGYGATTANLKGGLGSASVRTPAGFTVAAIVAVNAVGCATVGEGPHFWAAPYEQNGEFGGLGLPSAFPPEALRPRIKTADPANTTIAIVATDARISKGQAKRLAVMAHDGMARALRPSHAPFDGDLVFAAGTGTHPERIDLAALGEIGLAMGDVLARAIARGVYEAMALPFPKALPGWKDRFGR